MVYHQFAEPLSRKVYGGVPVNVWFLDGELRPHTRLSWETRPHSLDLGDGHRVVYLQGIQETEARGVAKVFQGHDMFRPGRKLSVTVKTVSSRYVVALAVGSDARKDAAAQAWLHRLAQPCSDQAFGGKPVDIWLYTQDGDPPLNLYWESRSVPARAERLRTSRVRHMQGRPANASPARSQNGSSAEHRSVA